MAAASTYLAVQTPGYLKELSRLAYPLSELSTKHEETIKGVLRRCFESGLNPDSINGTYGTVIGGAVQDARALIERQGPLSREEHGDLEAVFERCLLDGLFSRGLGQQPSCAPAEPANER